MINRVELKNFGPIEQLDWQNLSKINLIIGNNDCGKSFLLKALYSAMRTIEEYKRGDSPVFQEVGEILRNKLWWTFQPDFILDLVMKSSNADLSFCLTIDQKIFRYSFGEDSVKIQNFTTFENQIPPRQTDNSVFLPAKEVLSLHHLILKSRQQDKLFGFDDTYLDLAMALQAPPHPILQNDSLWDNSETNWDNGESHWDNDYDPKSLIRGYGSNDFNQSRKYLETIIGGRIEFDNVSKRWYFRKGTHRFTMGETAEGIKKIAILDYLLGNGYLNENSVIFIDELESNLHPEMISKLLGIVAILANHGIQIFIASHSYFVIKKLFLIAQEQQMSIPVLSYQNNEWVQSDLKEEVPNNPIIDESIRLYEQEVDLVFK